MNDALTRLSHVIEWEPDKKAVLSDASLSNGTAKERLDDLIAQLSQVYANENAKQARDEDAVYGYVFDSAPDISLPKSLIDAASQRQFSTHREPVNLAKQDPVLWLDYAVGALVALVICGVVTYLSFAPHSGQHQAYAEPAKPATIDERKKATSKVPEISQSGIVPASPSNADLTNRTQGAIPETDKLNPPSKSVDLATLIERTVDIKDNLLQETTNSPQTSNATASHSSVANNNQSTRPLSVPRVGRFRFLPNRMASLDALQLRQKKSQLAQTIPLPAKNPKKSRKRWRTRLARSTRHKRPTTKKAWKWENAPAEFSEKPSRKSPRELYEVVTVEPRTRRQGLLTVKAPKYKKYRKPVRSSYQRIQKPKSVKKSTVGKAWPKWGKRAMSHGN